MKTIKLWKSVFICIACILAMMVFPAAAFGQQEPVAASTDTFEMEYRYSEGTSPDIQNEISQFGRVYRLVSVSDPILESSLPETRTYTYKVTGYLTAAQLAEASGVGINATPVWHSFARQVDRREQIKTPAEGMPTDRSGREVNDVDALPQYKTYSDTSATTPGETTSGKLKLAEASFTVEAYGADGLPNDYTADVWYRGEETVSQLLYYDATGTYRGTETEENGSGVYVVIAKYETDVDPISMSSPPPEVSLPSEATPLSSGEAAGITFLQKVMGAACIAIFAILFIFLLFWLRKKRKEKTDNSPLLGADYQNNAPGASAALLRGGSCD